MVKLEGKTAVIAVESVDIGQAKATLTSQRSDVHEISHKIRHGVYDVGSGRIRRMCARPYSQ